MTSSSDENLIHLLKSISDELNLYLSLIIFIFGTVGNILNCLVLSQPTLRSNPCALYFLVSSIVDLVSIVFGLITRIMASWHLDPTSTNDWLCKCRAFVVFTSRTMAIWLIMLASIDRWLLSSRDFHLRKMSNLKIVKIGITVSLIVSIISYLHMLYCYQANLLYTPLKCYGKTIQCRLVTDLVYALITILIPSILMIMFSLMIISNVDRLRSRLQNMSIASLFISERKKELKLKKTDHQLLRMLLVQVVLLIIFCIPQAVQKFYITFKIFNSENHRQDALNNFLYNIGVLLAFIASGMPFYLYTLTGGSVFRKAFLDLLGVMGRKIICRLNEFS